MKLEELDHDEAVRVDRLVERVARQHEHVVILELDLRDKRTSHVMGAQRDYAPCPPACGEGWSPQLLHQNKMRFHIRQQHAFSFLKHVS